MNNLLTDQEISKFAWNLYREVSIINRALVARRTYICPMQPLLAEVPRQSTVLDIGCGNGLFLLLLAANNQIVNAVGTDLNNQALQNAEKAMDQLVKRGAKVTIDFIHAEHTQDWPQDNCFSVVSLMDVMHHIPPKKQYTVFSEAAKRVCPGGRLLYKDMCQRPFWQATANRLHDLIIARQWINYVPISVIKSWALSLGFAIEKESFYSKYVYGHEKIVFKKTNN